MTDPYNAPAPALPFDTIEFELTDAMRASLAAAKSAHESGDIPQREVSPGSGVYKLVRREHPDMEGK